MNWDTIEGNWKQFQGKVKEEWGKLTDDDIDVIAGNRDQLVGKLQERYGYVRQEAEQLVNDFCSRTNAGSSTSTTADTARTGVR